MKLYSILLTLFLSFYSFSASAIDCAEEVKYGVPDTYHGEALLCKSAFLVGYGMDIKQPRWTLMTLDKEGVNGYCDEQPDFIPDPEIPIEYQASNDDYYRNVWDKGHLSDRVSVDETCFAEHESVYYTNAAPQHEGLNRVAFRVLESRLRKLINKLDIEAYVMTGTVTHSQSKRTKTGLIIPDRFYKIIFVPEIQESIAFVFKNEPTKTKQLEHSFMSVRAFEDIFNIKTFDIPEYIKERAGKTFYPLYK